MGRMMGGGLRPCKAGISPSMGSEASGAVFGLQARPCRAGQGGKPPMLQSIEKGSVTEMDDVNGAERARLQRIYRSAPILA